MIFQAGLLQDPGCEAQRQHQRHQEGLPEVGQGAPSGPESGRPPGHREVPGSQHSLRRPQRRGQEEALRQVRRGVRQ